MTDAVAGWNATDEAGVFRIVAPDGRYELVATRMPEGRPFLKPRACAIGVACVRPVLNDTLWVNFTARLGVEVKGRLDAPWETGQLTVALVAANGEEYVSSARDRSTFTIHAPVGAYVVALRRDDGSASWTLECASPIESADASRCFLVGATGATLDLALGGDDILRDARRASGPPPFHPSVPAPEGPSVTVPAGEPLLALLAALLIHSSMRARKRQGR